ncbi:MAG: hypothetical protein MAG551_02183 [Candidatus Scalindua arabica]|uniref:Uncharacterized protein n=1 Tax=Candidatus Scalindua arabica TaxID=1127984 RepID=A0A941W4R0_9BACT|nr:hypothetical protein [Candidatus Scalindua arabica]
MIAITYDNNFSVRTPCPFPKIPCFLPVLEYTVHLNFLLSLHKDNDQKEQLSEIATRLRVDCQKHKNMIEKLIKHVQVE